MSHLNNITILVKWLENLKLLKAENQKVIEDIQRQHAQETEDFDLEKERELEQMRQAHEDEVLEMKAKQQEELQMLNSTNASTSGELNET